MKSALFVDFDNVYSGLRKLDPLVADRFARQPQQWVEWLVRSLPLPEDAPAGATRRRLLVRRCYLNPQVFQRFRPSFNRAGFEITDCPAMTSEGKTSTDIHMVLDIVELLQHETRYDEFILFSADADFTPVLRKLRRFDRRTTVLAVGFPSAAYQASADLLIDADDFVREALGFEEDDEALPAPGGVEAPEPPAPLVLAVPQPAALPLPRPQDAEEAAEVTRFIVDTVAAAVRPVPCARLAVMISGQHRELARDWGGHGSFRRFVETLDLGELAVMWNASGGCIYDPLRHGTPTQTNGSDTASAWGEDAELFALARQVNEATGTPLLTPAEYRALIEAVAEDLAQRPFQLTETGKRARDRCRDAGLSVSRADVNFLLRGLLLGGHVFGEGRDDAPTLARRLAANVLMLCRREQVPLDDAAVTAIERWVGSAGLAS
ncbi:NYN domain-containing protein [Caldimonas tepidiphila]|uniref:NYN domain-containing protein n=1 Tax=Caldimonas tepidiphila TaxID=2315841 RepID=UPI000E5B6230|nr:NYN domain-containing protein [Caldimonas tepidiphila]